MKIIIFSLITLSVLSQKPIPAPGLNLNKMLGEWWISLQAGSNANPNITLPYSCLSIAISNLTEDSSIV